MKNLLIYISVVSLIALLSACSKQMTECTCEIALPGKFDNIVIEPSMKGWELYSWQVDDEGCRKWNYVLVAGTDRLKSYAEITSDTMLRVSGEQQLKLLLNKFPAAANIVWIGEKWLSSIWGQSSLYYGNLKHPPAAIKNEVLQHAMQQGLELTLAP